MRTVLWAGEEQGGIGAQQYYDLHKVLHIVAFLNREKKIALHNEREQNYRNQ